MIFFSPPQHKVHAPTPKVKSGIRQWPLDVHFLNNTQKNLSSAVNNSGEKLGFNT